MSSGPGWLKSGAWLKSGFAIALLFGLIWWVSPAGLADAFQNITLSLIVFLLFISFVLIFISALKWKVLLSGLGKREGLGRLFSLYLIGYFVNLLLPSYLGGDAVRSWYLGKRHGQHDALTATVLERYSGIVAMIFLACIFMWFSPHVVPSVRWTVIGISVCAVLGTAFAFSPVSLDLLGKVPSVGSKIKNHGKLLQESLFLISGQKRVVAQAVGLSLLFHSITVVNVLAAAWAVGWFEAPTFELFVVLPVILILSAIPVTPQAIGYQEGVFLFYLSQLGATTEQALGVALIIRAKAYVLAAIGGVFWWLERGRKGEISISSQ